MVSDSKSDCSKNSSSMNSYLAGASNPEQESEVQSNQNNSIRKLKRIMGENDSSSKNSDAVSSSIYDNFSSKLETPPVQNVQSTKGCGCVATVLIVEDNFYNVVPLKMMLR